jgi:hypothetical protein
LQGILATPSGTYGIQGSIDRVYYHKTIHRTDFGSFKSYLGYGAMMRSGTVLNFGLRGPLGIEFTLTSVPVSLFIEISPVIILTPVIGITSQQGIGVRYEW